LEGATENLGLYCPKVSRSRQRMSQQLLAVVLHYLLALYPGLIRHPVSTSSVYKSLGSFESFGQAGVTRPLSSRPSTYLNSPHVQLRAYDECGDTAAETATPAILYPLTIYTMIVDKAMCKWYKASLFSCHLFQRLASE